MRTTRQTPFAMNTPLQILGLNVVAVGACLLCALIVRHWSGKAAVGVFIALAAAVKYAEHIDRNWYKTLPMALGFKAVYDPIKREHFETEVSK